MVDSRFGKLASGVVTLSVFVLMENVGIPKNVAAIVALIEFALEFNCPNTPFMKTLLTYGLIIEALGMWSVAGLGLKVAFCFSFLVFCFKS